MITRDERIRNLCKKKEGRLERHRPFPSYHHHLLFPPSSCSTSTNHSWPPSPTFYNFAALNWDLSIRRVPLPLALIPRIRCRLLRARMPRRWCHELPSAWKKVSVVAHVQRVDDME
ncbi:hypothetical protein M422DRAFT_784952 [Sphaerobolus stellatus SS14]|uniref:Uncharacterized protein n=1 Tax=Sphaerobolus stellatus (strain SS14) TaxID=990650 RepID=A0A0C9UEB7_SPHS4|nr:hypothetical protein M422DRAFT_784952 [Sphaerobolus stellatus SS14]